MNREQYLEYVDHFNNKRYDAVTSYFAPDVTVEYPTKWGDTTLHSRQEFIDWYKNLHAHVREVLEVGDYLASEDMIAVELYTEFHCFKDFMEYFKKGDVMIMTHWVIYDLEDGKMKRIRILHFRDYDPKLAKF